MLVICKKGRIKDLYMPCNSNGALKTSMVDESNLR